LYAFTLQTFQPEAHGTGQQLEPRWQKGRQFVLRHPSARQIPALLDKGSLTARLVSASGGDFKVKVLYQGWQRPRRSEARLLGMPERQMAIAREVALCCFDEPWVYARSILPVTTVTGRLRHLRKFDDSALGAMLFKDRSMHRTDYELADFRGLSTLLPSQLQHKQAGFGRRSCFFLDDKPLMVSEIFLDGFKA